MSGLVKEIHIGNSVDGVWFSGTVRNPIVLLEYGDVTRTWEKDP
jgi:hypothetical protein